MCMHTSINTGQSISELAFVWLFLGLCFMPALCIIQITILILHITNYKKLVNK